MRQINKWVTGAGTLRQRLEQEVKCDVCARAQVWISPYGAPVSKCPFRCGETRGECVLCESSWEPVVVPERLFTFGPSFCAC